MRSLFAAVLALSCTFLTASCVQSPKPGEEHGSAGEPTGEAQEPLPLVGYKPEQFPFVTVIKDDGKDEGGGWQEAKANLDFTNWVFPHLPRTWWCPITVGMPLRTNAFGSISASRAARITVPVAEDAARTMDFDLPPGIFCKRFVEGARGLFKVRWRTLGVRVTSR